MNTKNFDPYDFSKKEINGVSIFYKNLPQAPCINVRVVFNVGAFDDPVGKEGISHFLEHMLLKGCPSIPNKKSIREWSKINALNTLNGFTNYDNTAVTLKCLPEKYDIVIAGLKDMIFHSFLKLEDIEEERKVITQEAWGRFLNEKFLKYTKEFIDIVYWGNQHSRTSSPLGWPETIEKISQEDIVDWHTENYGIGNFYVVLTGAVEEENVLKMRDFLKDVPEVNVQYTNFGTINKPKQNRIVKTADEIGEVKEQVEISVCRIKEETSYENNEIVSIYNQLIRDLLNEKLRTELSLCYSVSSQISRTNKFTATVINIKTDEKNIELVEKEFKKIAEDIINKKHTERFELIKSLRKQQIESEELSSTEIADEALREISRFKDRIMTQKEQLDFIEKVTYDDIIKFTMDIFDPEFSVTEIILPSKK